MKVNRLEDRIRDYLAEHLDILEVGLEYVEKEYRLSTTDGAGGRIDIVGKDRFGHVVAIEIKRSDQAARQALSEIHKYTALFRIKQGLDERRLRLLVVSTEWHELLLPLAEFAAVTPYAVDGISIEVDSSGTVFAATRLDLHAARNDARAIEISRCQGIYLFRSLVDRNAFAKLLPQQVEAVGVQDFALFACEYRGQNEGVVFPYGVYLCFSSPLLMADQIRLQQIKKVIGWDSDLDEPDENFLCAIWDQQKKHADDFEIGSPEKLATMASGWDVTVDTRGGRLASKQSVLPDDELIALAKCLDGGSDTYLGKTTSPRFRAAWTTLKSQIGVVVAGYPTWEEIVPKILREIERKTPNASVTVSVYGPADLLIGLYAIALIGDYSRCPHFEIVVEDSDAGSAKVFLGLLAWGGKRITADFASVERSVCGQGMKWWLAQISGGVADFEWKALNAHDLDTPIVEWRFSRAAESGPHEIVIHKGRLSRNAPKQWQYKPIREFAELHDEYLAQLRASIEETTFGIRESILATVKGRNPA